jgi:MFS family permease
VRAPASRWPGAGAFDRFRGFQPDARRFLLVTLVAGAATSLWWIDFNLFLASLGLSPSRIGLISAAGSAAMALSAFPASALSDRFGRRAVMVGGVMASIVAVVGLVATSNELAILVLVALYGVGSEAVQVVATPFMTEHSSPEHRSELFAAQYALTSVTNIIAAALGGVVARVIADRLGFAVGGAETYRVILVFMALLLLAGLLVMLRLRDDRPAPGVRRVAGRSSLGRLGLTIVNRRAFGRILLPGLLIAIGAGQVIPFLNLFVQEKFGLDLVALNGLFALTSIGTMAAILYQPTLARRFGRLRSVVLVQGASIPFLIVLGFSPLLWTVIAAMAVRNSLMNAGNPIFTAFAMDRVSRAERATLAAAMSVLWSAGWVIAGGYYSIVQAILGFEAGYALNFATIIVLYSIATFLYWHWFRDVEHLPAEAAPLAA